MKLFNAGRMSSFWIVFVFLYDGVKSEVIPITEADSVARPTDSEARDLNERNALALSKIDARLQNMERDLNAFHSYVRDSLETIKRRVSLSMARNKKCCHQTRRVCQVAANSLQAVIPTTPAPTCSWGYTLFSGSCYMIVDSVSDRSLASIYCMKSGGYLVNINNGKEQRYLKATLKAMVSNAEESLKVASLWIGASKTSSSSQFKWDNTGDDVIFTNWANDASELRGANRSEGQQYVCVALNATTGAWIQRDCSIGMGYICEKQTD